MALWCYGVTVLWHYSVMVLWSDDEDEVSVFLNSLLFPVQSFLCSPIDVQIAVINSSLICFLRLSSNVCPSRQSSDNRLSRASLDNCRSQWSSYLRFLRASFSRLCSSVNQAVKVGTGLRVVMPCGWGVKAGMVCAWVAGKTVWSPCYTRPYLSALEVRHDEALHKSTFTLLYLLAGPF